MGRLLPVALGLVADDVRGAAGRARRSAIVWGAVAVLAVTAYVFGVLAAFWTLAETRPPIEAAWIVAAATVALAAVVIAAATAVGTVERRRQTRRHAELRTELTVALSALPLVFRSKPLLIAAAIGTLAFLGAQRGTAKED